MSNETRIHTPREEEFDAFISNAALVQTRPVLWRAKRIKSVRCLNPRQKISYHYERVHRMTFGDGTTMTRCEDHWRRPGVQMKKGNYVLLLDAYCIERYVTPEELPHGYTFL